MLLGGASILGPHKGALRTVVTYTIEVRALCFNSSLGNQHHIIESLNNFMTIVVTRLFLHWLIREHLARSLSQHTS